MEKQLKIGQLAQRGQVNLQTIRYYEREGLLPKPPRLASGYRVFSSDAVRRVRFIKRAQELGFSLKEIKELLSVRIDPASDCSGVQKLAKAKVSDIEQKIRTLQGMKKPIVRIKWVFPDITVLIRRWGRSRGRRPPLGRAASLLESLSIVHDTHGILPR